MIDGVLVLAAGKSSRIAAASAGTPKPLIAVGGVPVLERNLQWLADQGVRELWINLHYRPEAIREAIGDGSRFGLRVRYSYEPEILGTAGAWKRLEAHWSGTSLVVYGDNLLQFGLADFVQRHRTGRVPGTIALFDPDRHRHTGIAGGHVELGDGGRVVRFIEGPRPDDGHRYYVNAGAYLLEPAVAAALAGGFQDFAKDLFPRLAAADQLAGHVLEPEGYCLGIDTPASLATAQALIHSLPAEPHLS
jgi:NDP-sugar pyrophosphorylase family protein